MPLLSRAASLVGAVGIFGGHPLGPTTSAEEASAPDISSITPDLIVPGITQGDPGAGRRVLFHVPGEPPERPKSVVYLPTDWEPGETFPVIVELAGNGNFRNRYGDTSEGRPEGSRLGYGLTGGQEWIWICLPYLDEAGEEVAITWWGDPPDRRPDSTVAFLKRAVPALCARFGGDPDRIVLAGFSRGAIACHALGLHDEEIARLWAGFFAYSHFDGVRESWPFPGADRDSAGDRLSRLGDRPVFICHESTAGSLNLDATRRYLESTGVEGKFRFVETGFRNHNDAWLLRPSPARKEARAWLRTVPPRPAASR